MSDNINLFGYNISTLSADLICDNCFFKLPNTTIVNTINPHSYVVSKSDELFKSALLSSDYLLPDGSGIILGAKLLHGLSVPKLSGYTFFTSAMQKLDLVGGRVFFLGSTDNTLSLIKERCKKDYPNVVVSTFSPPFTPSFTDFQLTSFANIINDFKPTALFVGMTAPKQEKLIFELKSKLSQDLKLISGVGAVFDFYAGTVVRPSDIWIRLHLEWLIRFFRSPKRLWRRNFISTPIFIFDLFISFFTQR